MLLEMPKETYPVPGIYGGGSLQTACYLGSLEADARLQSTGHCCFFVMSVPCQAYTEQLLK